MAAGGMFPNDTPAQDLGLTDQEVQMLTAKARTVTKAELVTLRKVTERFRSQGEDKVVEVYDQQTGLNLNIGDIESIAHAFNHAQDRINTEGGAGLEGDACCCCSCCPCCSCTASVVIDATH